MVLAILGIHIHAKGSDSYNISCEARREPRKKPRISKTELLKNTNEKPLAFHTY